MNAFFGLCFENKGLSSRLWVCVVKISQYLVCNLL
jgi:hypothetical protein